jgi:hypothetical protein
MAVINITVTESVEQIVSGIPRTIGITTNIPATIFYTLDGTTPTLFSDMYIDTIVMPRDKLSIILNILATNGVDTAPILTETYATNMLNNARLGHSATTAEAGESIPPLYPFGTPDTQPTGQFLNPGDAGVTVDNPALPSTATGFDGQGNPVGFTNNPYDLVNYNIIYPTRDAEGQPIPLVGTLPGNVTVNPVIAPPNETEQFSALFDPRAFVIFQDSTKENPDDPPNINRMHFTLEDAERARDGNAYFNTGLDAPPVSGTFLRSHYNARTNMMTYYYLDTWTNKWIISTQPFVPNKNVSNNLSGVMASARGSNKVFEWIPFTRRVLF